MRAAKFSVKRLTNSRISIPLTLILINTFVVITILHVYQAKNKLTVIYRDPVENGDGTLSKVNITIKRVNMSKCDHIYGNISVFIAVEAVAYNKLYKVALDTIRCYIASTDYKLLIVDIFNDSRVEANCSKYKNVFFRKHCAAAVYLEDTDWLFVLDADTGIVNPDHCIEEYIDDRVDMIFYERFFSWEIVSANYLAKKTPFSKDFLLRWANYEHFERGGPWWKGFDNGALQINFLESILPKDSQEVKNCHQIWYTSTGLETYFPYVMCVRIYLGATRIWPRKLKLLRRVHSFCRDWYYTSDAWCEKDFMMHGWKAQHVGEKGWQSPFATDIDVSKCGANYDGWPWRPEKKVSCDKLRKDWAQSEKYVAKGVPQGRLVIPFLNVSDIGDCYPDCDIRERIHGT